MTLHYLLPHIAAAEFDEIEVWQWHATTPSLPELEIIREQADVLGVSMPYIGVYPVFHLEDGEEADQCQAELMDLIDRARILGATGFKLMLGRRKGHDITPEEQTRHDTRFGVWYDACVAAGIQVVAELHGGTLLDPWEYGKKWLQNHPEFDVKICYQPYNFGDMDAALALADEFADRIVHIHLQASRDGKHVLLQNAPIDYARLLKRLLEHNPNATMTLEFVQDCIQNNQPFDLILVLQNAKTDAAFVRNLVAGGCRTTKRVSSVKKRRP